VTVIFTMPVVTLGLIRLNSLIAYSTWSGVTHDLPSHLSGSSARA